MRRATRPLRRVARQVGPTWDQRSRATQAADPSPRQGQGRRGVPRVQHARLAPRIRLRNERTERGRARAVLALSQNRLRRTTQPACARSDYRISTPASKLLFTTLVTWMTYAPLALALAVNGLTMALFFAPAAAKMSKLVSTCAPLRVTLNVREPAV